MQRIREFKIFDRWGDHVFEDYNFLPNDPAHGWVGTFQDQEMGPTVFAFFAVGEFLDGEGQ